MSCRVRIDAPAGIIEIEGDAIFVSDFFDKLLPIVEQARFGGKSSEAPGEVDSDDVVVADDLNGDVAPQKKKRKVGKRTPVGQSCRSRMNVLKADHFFKEKRSAPDIVQGLAKKGWTHTASQIGASLSDMFKAGEIQRTKEGSSFEYYWDRA